MGEQWQPYINNYKVNIFEIAWLEPEQVKQFKSDFRFVADYFVQMRKNKHYVPSKDTIQHVDEVLKLMEAVTQDTKFTEVQNSIKGRKRGEVSMYSVLGEVEERGEKRGEERVSQLNKYLLDENRMEDLRRATYDQDYRQQLYKEYGISFVREEESE